MFQDLNDISDGKIYTENDMVRVAANDCAGCHACCEGMGDTIILDPLDVHRLCAVTGKSFEELMQQELELHAVEGLILPNLAMVGEKERCAFLNENGRCTIHSHRPGLCRVFPLGRIYETHGIRYFLQTNACQKSERTKKKISRWLDMPDGKKYEQFLLRWHSLRGKLTQALLGEQSDEMKKALNLFVLRLFFLTPYDAATDFYEQFYERAAKVERLLAES